MLKRLVDKSNASVLSGAELKKLVQESYFSVLPLCFTCLPPAVGGHI